MSDNKKQNEQIRVNMQPEIARGCYSNAARVVHSNHEFVFDYLLSMPEDKTLVARVVMSPQHAKSFCEALQNNLRLFEEKFGTIQLQHSNSGEEFH